MRVILSRERGFCSGVRQAVELAHEAAERARASGRTAWTLGPLIHNRQAVADLERAGVRLCERLEDVPQGDLLVIPSHGARPEAVALAEEKGIIVVDATCPLVRKVQHAARDLRSRGYRLVIVGQAAHTEVKSVLGWAGEEAVVIEEVDQVSAYAGPWKTAVVSQTTQRPERVREITERLRTGGGEVHLEPTLCPATSQRQEEARALAGRARVMLVVGGKESANTRKLAEIGRESGCRVHHVETAQEVDPSWFVGVDAVAVTAGTSTPDWITKEVVSRMKEIDQAEEARKSAGEGERVTGTVVSLTETEALVDLGGKTEGILPLGEMGRHPAARPADMLEAGQVVDVVVIKIDEDGRPLLSRKQVEEDEAWGELERAFENQTVVEAPVTAQVKGGLVADVGTRGFIPASQVGLNFVKDLSPYVGTTLRTKIIELDRDSRKVVLSEKKVLEEERDAGRSLLLEGLAEGEIRKGEVKRVTDYGAFVDLGGIDGLLHVSEMSWRRVSDPREIVKEGDSVEVRVLKVDHEKGRVSLGLRQTEPDPWSLVATKYPPGTVITGKAVSVTAFGAFVQLEDGIEGLVHVSQLSEKRISHPSEVVRVGDEVRVKILKVSPSERRISLSAREAEEELDRKQIKQFLKTGRDEAMTTIGDMVGDVLRNAGRGDGKNAKPAAKKK